MNIYYRDVLEDEVYITDRNFSKRKRKICKCLPLINDFFILNNNS